MKMLKLTNSDNKKILVNFQNVTHVIPTDSGSVIYTIKESGYHIINVTESLDDILDEINNK